MMYLDNRILFLVVLAKILINLSMLAVLILRQVFNHILNTHLHSSISFLASFYPFD